MKLTDLFSLNLDFRSLRLLSGRISPELEFRHLFLYHRGCSHCSPGDCVIAVDIQLPWDAAELSRLLSDTAICSIAALIIRADSGCTLSDPCQELGPRCPPVLALPLSADLDMIVYSLQAALQSEDRYLDYLFAAFQQDLEQMRQKKLTHASLISLLASYIQTPVFLFSHRHVLPLHCADSPEWETAKALWKVLAASGEQPEYIAQEGMLYCFFPVTDSRETIASICLVYPDGLKPTAADELLLSAAQPHLSFCILHYMQKDRFYYKDTSQFLMAILAGEVDANTEFARQNAEFLTIDDAQCRILWTVELSPTSALQSNTYFHRVSDYFTSLYCRFFSLRMPHRFIYIVECSAPQPLLSKFANCVLPQLEALQHTTAGLQIQMGSSCDFHRLSDLPHALEEAEFSLKIGKKIKPGTLHYSYDDYILYHLLDNIKSTPGIAAIHSEIILKLYEYDQQNGSELLTTFLSLCRYNFNTIQAADEMYLHRNSFYKRIERISSVLSMDSNSLDNRIIFQLAAKLHELFN